MKIVRNHIVPFKGFEAMNLFGLLLCRKEARIGEVTMNHERIHTAQMREMLYVPFYIWYGIEWLLRLAVCRDRLEAYRKIRFEQEAYAHQSDKHYLQHRKCFAWLRSAS